MDIVYACCAGLDVHKETVVATVRCRSEQGPVRQQTRTFGTMTGELLALADWLTPVNGCKWCQSSCRRGTQKG